MYTLEDLFHVPGGATEQVRRLELFKTALADAFKAGEEGRTRVAFGAGAEGEPKYRLTTGLPAAQASQAFDTITKSLTADQANSLANELQLMRGTVMPDLQKDWTPTSPVNVQPYDLLPAVKWLAPSFTPLRNRIPRTRGEGGAAEYRRILSVTNSGGASADSMGFFDSASQTQTFGGPGNLTLNRPAKISYTGDTQIRKYLEMGHSDQVNWRAHFAGLGFDDPRSQSQTALLLAHLNGEERAMLYGRGTAAGNAGYLGAVSAPVISATNEGTGGSLAADTYHCYVVAKNGMGQSLASAVSSTVTTGATSTITVEVTTEPDGALFYDLYVGDGSAGFANAKLQESNFVGNTVTITSFNASGAAGVDADSSFSALAWDGFYAVQSDPNQTGYFNRANAAFSTADPGSEITDALVALWTLNGATPEELWMTGNGADELGKLLRAGGANGAVNGYRTTVQTGDGSVILGAAVSGIVNPVTRGIVDINAHRYAAAGTVLLLSRTVPVPNSEVGAPVTMRMVQDYMGIAWPVVQMSWDISSYEYGTMLHQAPMFSGMIAGLTNG